MKDTSATWNGNILLPLLFQEVWHLSGLFFNYLWKEGHISKDPAENLKPPKVEKKAPEILTIEEVDKLLQQPDLNTVKGIRDSADAGTFVCHRNACQRDASSADSQM